MFAHVYKIIVTVALQLLSVNMARNIKLHRTVNTCKKILKINSKIATFHYKIITPTIIM